MCCREAAALKAAEAARKKAELKAIEDAELASLPTTKKSGNAKTAQKKTRGLDLSQLDTVGGPALSAGSLNATGIDNALDALEIVDGPGRVEQRPERRFKAAYAAFEERRLEEEKDDKSLRRNQKIANFRKEFERSPENPFNQVSAAYNSTKEELAAVKLAAKEKTEARLVSSP
jgi:hypothetical protein